MTPENTHRRLAAVMSADVVGFSRLVGSDEAGTLFTLGNHRAELIEPRITEHQGRVVKLMGDGLLAEFASAIDAVRCAVGIQKGMTARNSGVPEDRQISFRIGINLGDVVVEDDDILGDGVNIAARLQEAAEPGGICVSAAVYGQIDGKVDLSFIDLGKLQLKNIADLVSAYKVALMGGSRSIEQHPMFDMIGGSEVPVTGGCLCGEIRFKITKPVIDTNFCHCRMCQRFAGAPVIAGSTYPADSLHYTKGQPKYYHSSPFAERGFCPNCGSSLTYRPLSPAVSPNWKDWILLFTASLDNPSPNAPAWHLGWESRMPWTDIHHASKRVCCQDAPDIVEAWANFGLPVP